MARYIDADALMEKLLSRLKDGEVLYRISPQEIDDAPTADVVPKSEVANVIDEIKRYIRLNEDIAIKCKEENGEQNREYFKGKLAAFLQIRGFIDVELKKKYTEDQNDDH